MIAFDKAMARESFFEGNNQHWNSHVDAEFRNRVMNAGQGGLEWEPIVGTAGAIVLVRNMGRTSRLISKLGTF